MSSLLGQREQLPFDALRALALGRSLGWCEGSFQLRGNTGAEKFYRAEQLFSLGLLSVVEPGLMTSKLSH